jgi:hypothetical protein
MRGTAMLICTCVVRDNHEIGRNGKKPANSNLETAVEDLWLPLRGLMLASVLSAILWTGLILSASRIWVLCH